MVDPDALDPAAERLRHVSAVTKVALTHLALDDLVDELLTRVRDILHTDTAAVLLLDGDTDELVALARKGLEEEVERGVRIPVGAGFAGRIAAERRAVLISDLDRAEVLNPAFREEGITTLLGVPLMVEGDVIGVLHVGTRDPRDFGESDSELLQLVADRMAVAIDHARLYESEREARAMAERQAQELAQIQTITDAALGRLSIDEDILGSMLDRVRDVLGVDTAAILLLSHDGAELVARAARGIEEEVERGVRILVGRGFAGRIAAQRKPVILEDVNHVDVLNPLLREKGIRSMVGVPLLIGDRVIGVLHVGTLQPRSFSPADVGLLERAGDRIAVTIDRARQHTVAEVLQRSVLPEALPVHPGVTMAARYLPGTDDAHVGGDWYDVVPLSGGKLGIAIGDVVSRGVRAAASMGQMRIALRAYAADGDPPGRVLDRLDRLVRGLDRRDMATVAYVVLDPAGPTAAYALAGHPPPLVISGDGETRYLDEVRSRPIGVAALRRYDEAAAELEPGDTLLLYTDGVVEGPGLSLDEGMAQLARAAAEGPRDPERLCDELTERATARIDDVALLAVRLVPGSFEPLRLCLDASPESLGTLRRALRDWLGAAGVSDDEGYDIVVAAGEAAANAIEHAYGPGQAEFEVRAELAGDAVAVTVRDDGSWRPARGAHRGRGLGLIRELMDDLEVSSTELGTDVVMRRSFQPEEAT